MRGHVIKTVFLKELREMLRDRRSLLIMFGVPLVLYPLLTLAMAGVGVSKEKELRAAAAKVVVRGGDAAPHLVEMLTADRGFALSTPADAEAELRADKVDAILDVPPGAEAALTGDASPSTQPTTLAATVPSTAPSAPPAGPEVVVTVNRGRFRAASSVEAKIDRLLKDYQQWVIERRLARRGVDASVLEPVRKRTVDVSTGEQRLGSLMASALPLFLLLTGMLGAFFPALNATTTERERGTLESLLATPAARAEILLGKGLVVLIASLLTAGLNVGSMALVLWRLFATAGAGAGKAPLDVALSPGALALTFLAAVPTLIFFVGLVLIVGLLARTFQEANTLAMPVMILPISSAIIGIADPATTPGLLLTPIANTTVIIRDVLTGRATAGAFLLAFASSCLYAGLLLSAAARLFGTEQLVNPAWEPLSLKGLGKRTARRRPRLPSVEEALALWVTTILLTLYVSPSFMGRPFLELLTITEVLLVAAPAVLLSLVARYPWVATFAWQKSFVAALLGAAMVGIGIVPIVNLVYGLQNVIWPASPETLRRQLEAFLPPMQQHPVLTVVAIGVLAGVCEEVLYRGPIQTALLRKSRPWVGLTIGAALFSAAHLDLHGFPVRMALGLLLGYVVWRSKSIFPAMLLHGLFDATQMTLFAVTLHTEGVARTTELALNPRLTFDAGMLVQLAIAVPLVAAGWWLLGRAWAGSNRDSKGPPRPEGDTIVP